MMVHVAEETGKVLYCPLCERELIPAYWSDEGLEVSYWCDSAPEAGQEGLLVCGNFDCGYEEAVTFTDASADAVMLCFEDTHMQFWMENDYSISQVQFLGIVSELQEAYARIGWAKLRCAIQWFEQEAETLRDKVDRWLVEAANGYPVSFQVHREKFAGQILTSEEDSFLVQFENGEFREFMKCDTYGVHIDYPRKPRKPYKPGDHTIHCRNDARIVVNGYHLYHRGVDELGYHEGCIWDREIAEPLRLKEEAPGFFRGLFRPEEIERYYWRRVYVKIRGYWVEDHGRTGDENFVWVRTTDPEAARALDLVPRYWMTGNEFGGFDGDLACFDESLPVAEIEDTAEDEEVQPLPNR